jgi:hypothetical protein
MLNAILSSAFKKRCFIFGGIKFLAGGMNTTERI